MTRCRRRASAALALLALALPALAPAAAQPPAPPPPARAAAATSDSARAARAARAAIDSLNAYWRDLDVRWYEPLTPDLLAPGPGDAALDSLARAGDAELAALLSGRRWRTTVAPLARLAFERCEGLRPGVALRGRRLVRHGARVEAGLGYGIARERFVWDATVTLPLAVAAPRDAGGRLRGRSWPRLTLELTGGDRVVSFAGRRDLSDQFDAFLNGLDPAMYHAARGGGAALAWRPRCDLTLRGGWSYDEQRPLPVVTRWSLLGDRADVPDNWAADRLVSRDAGLDVAARLGPFALDAGARRRALALADPAAPVADGALWTMGAGLRAGWLSPQGHEVALRGEWRRNDRRAPLQSRLWLGGPGSLRGYPVRELAGDDAALVALDLRAGWDPLRALRLPLLRSLGLQPIVFADWGRARRDGAPPTPGSANGWRADVGVGLGKLLGAAGLGGHLRVYAAKPVGNGQADRDWQFLLELEP